MSQDTEIALKIGISQGGPVIAGTLEFKRPWFQLIGEVGEMATKMMRTAPSGNFQVTRQVYKLIFSAGFHIYEQGKTIISGDWTVRTYLVDAFN